MESPRDRFFLLVRQRHQVQECIDNFKNPREINGKFDTLGYVDQLVLAAAYLLRGEGSSLNIDEKVDDLTTKFIDNGAIFISLDRLERARLISSRRDESNPDAPRVLFTVTPEGLTALGEVRAGAKKLMDALIDIA